jgi:bacterioferritin-associated ferredoxin
VVAVIGEDIPMNTGLVDRCVCRDVLLAEMVRMQSEGASFERIRQKTGCGQQCGLCVPYIRAALATGRVSLPVMTTLQLRALAKAPAAIAG